MADSLTVEADVTPLQKLVDVMNDYVTLTGKDASAALNKAGREVDFALYQEFHRSPPRPVRGSISDAAKARGYTLNTNSDSYTTGYAQAMSILGGAKSGYFRITEKNGVATADPVFISRTGRTYGGRSKKRGQYSKLLGAADGVSPPPGAKLLNLGALAALLTIFQREKAGAGGYMSTEFLTFEAFRNTATGITFTAKNKKTIGQVDISDSKITITGKVDNSAQMSERYGITDRALSRGADAYRADMYDYVRKKAEQTLAALGKN